ncbi:MAG: COX15/CtaA family protein [Terriglobales bacterium]
MNAVSTPYNAAHHRFAVFTACATFCLLIAGALVTSNDAGLSVPDWPTSYGSFYKLPPWTGGIIYEHSHRMFAEFIGTLTIAIAVWTWVSDKRKWMKGLAVAALGTIIAQGILGGLTVLYFLPPLVSSAHAAVGQTFFCIACGIALFTGRDWVKEVRPAANDSGRPRLLSLALLSIFVLYAQLLLGAMFRHHGMSWLPHVVNAPLVGVVLTWAAVTALVRYGDVQAIRRPAVAILFLLVIQLCLGFLAFLTRVEWGRDAAQPEFPMVASTVAHVATGALLLAATYVLTMQVWRLVPSEAAAKVRRKSREPVAA